MDDEAALVHLAQMASAAVERARFYHERGESKAPDPGLRLALVGTPPVRQGVQQDLDRRLAVRPVELLAYLAKVVTGRRGLAGRGAEL